MARRKCQFIMTFSPGFLILFTLFRGVNAGFVRLYKGLLCFVLCFMGVILIDVIFFALDDHTNGHRVVYKMNNHCDEDCDEEWFEYKEVFNKEDGENWVTNSKKICFPKEKKWQQYVDSMRLEITCGEAPYLVSRYDTTTGEIISVHNRIGQLDRKLRVVGENTNTKEEWLKWAIRAFQSIYGYEYLLLCNYLVLSVASV